MRILFFILSLAIWAQLGCQSKQAVSDTSHSSMKYVAKNSSTQLTCKMLPDELRIRKETVLASLKEKIIDRKELKNGYAFKFPGNDLVVDELVEFIKTERECCDFFIFNLSVSGDKTEAWLEMTGVEGAKDFITEELGL